MGTEGQLPNRQFDIQGDIAFLQAAGVLKSLLTDKTTGRHILWGTEAYADKGPEYARDQEMEIGQIVGENLGLLKTRAQKAAEQQTERTRQHAEVFTPAWICRMMNDQADSEWFGREEVFFRKDGTPTERVDFKRKSWKRYVDSKRLEITCGEAPYLVSRYDVSSGKPIPLARRAGMLDRKLRVVNENTDTEADWLKWTFRAYEATYGYEFQGDNLLIARVNLIMTFVETLDARWHREPTGKEWQRLSRIVTWNIWQMDGLTYTLPYAKGHELIEQTDFLLQFGFPPIQDERQPACRVYLWRYLKASTAFQKIKEGAEGMKFDFIIGNPPYQDETVGEQKQFAPPIYHLFMDESYKVSNAVELIHPARFLFNAGGTPKDWNQKMLNDSHFTVLYHEQDSSKIFPNTDIKGGVAISYYDHRKNIGPLITYTAFTELNAIMHKVIGTSDFSPFSSIIYNRGLYRFSPKVYAEHPDEMGKITDSRIGASSFERISSLFFESKPNTDSEYVQIYGLLNGKRTYRWFRKDYFNQVENFENYKVMVPAANGSGTLGETLSTPIVAQPFIGHTETFLSIGNFRTPFEAESCLKYVKSKFCRVMLGILKITQHNSPEKWRFVPLQDFTPSSDIDWSVSIPEIDRQLYAKYGLDENEIAFIESHVKEMV